MSDDGTFTWKARTRGCQCCKWKDERIAELEPQLASAEKPDLAEALRLLKLAACPANCYGGAIDCGGYQHPCQWCDEVEAMVAKIEESE